MLIQLEQFKSAHPDFTAPLAHNGEPMELVSVELSGPYLVTRYFTLLPVLGPRLERYIVDLYLNSEGRQIFRIDAKLIDTPPPPPTFGKRLSQAWATVFP